MTHNDDWSKLDDELFTPFSLFRGRMIDADYIDQTVPSYRGNPLIESLPREFADDTEVAKALMQRPDFSVAMRNLSGRDRIHSIGDLEDQFFQPLSHHLSLQLKISRMIRRGYVMRNPFIPGVYQETLKILDSALDLTQPMILRRPKAFGFNLIGPSGIGKSYSLESILFLLPQVIRHSMYRGRHFPRRQLVWLKLDCPYDGLLSGLSHNFFEAVDDVLETSYKKAYARTSVDGLLRGMARVAANHFLGVLVIDEIQVLRAMRSENSEKVLNFLVNLVNTIGVPVLLVGTDKARKLFESQPRQARRGTGQGSEVWYLMRNDDTWSLFLTALFQYQYIQKPVELTAELLSTFFEETQGITDLVVKLYVQSQIRAIRTGHETLTPQIVRSVALDSFQMLRPAIMALKKGDKRALAELEDIYPFWREEYARLGQQPNQIPEIANISDRTPEQSSDEQTSKAQLNLQTEQTQVEETPKASPNNELQNARRSKRQKDRVYPADSLLTLVKNGKTKGITPYQAIREGGHIFSFECHVSSKRGTFRTIAE